MTTTAMLPMMATGMSEEQQALFYAQMSAVEKDEVAGVLLALFLGIFGLHHFYLRRTGLGVLYLLFFWTGIPALLGFVECFLMPSRVRRFNLEQAAILAASIRGVSPQLSPMNPGLMPGPFPDAGLVAGHCPACGASVAPGVRFCAHCGSAVQAGA